MFRLFFYPEVCLFSPPRLALMLTMCEQTKGKSLEQIDLLFSGPKVPARSTKVAIGAVAAGRNQRCSGGTSQGVCGSWW